MVSVLLNMAFAPRVVLKDFTFGPGISKTFKEAVAKNVLVDFTIQGEENNN